VLSHQGDEGTLINGAVRVAEGQLPFRDFFEVMGPGTFYWLALFFKLLGTTWLATRICLLFTTLGTTVLIFYLARRLRCGWEPVPVIFFVAVSYHNWNAISHHTDSNLVGLLSFAALLSGLDRRQPFMLILAGVGAGITTWFMLPKGVLLCLSFIATLWVIHRKDACFRPYLTRLLGGYVLIVALVAALFWRAGGLPHLVYANLIWPLTNYSGINVVPYGLEFRELYWKSFSASFGAVAAPPVAAAISTFLCIPFLIVMGLPLVLLTLGIRYKRASFDRVVLPYWLVGLAFWFSEMHRKDLPHIAFGSPILIVLAFYLYRQVPGKWASRALQLAGISALALAMLNPLVALSAPARHTTRRGVVNVFGADAVLDFVTTRVKPGEPIFVYPYAPIYYFLSGAKNPTPFSILMYHMNTDSQFRTVVACLESKKVRYVVWDRSFPTWVHKSFPAYRIPPVGEQIVEPFLLEHYRVVGGSENGYQFLERKDSTILRGDRAAAGGATGNQVIADRLRGEHAQ
jgi:hypothetical protein